MAVMTKSEKIEQIRNLHHDIQNCLGVISMGTEVLSQVRNDADAFADVVASIEKERKQAASLLLQWYESTFAEGEEC